MSDSNCFDFLDVPVRAPKPRKRGLTVASDYGLAEAEARALVETCGDLIDFVKMPDHHGIMKRYSEKWLQEKNAYYRGVGIETTTGGIVYEVAAVQGQVPRFMERIADLGFSGVEVSEDMIGPLPLNDRHAAIRKALDCDLHVFTELGRKFPEKPLGAAEAIEMARADLDAGAALVVIERSDIARIVADESDTLHRLVEAVPQEKLVFEAGPGDWTPIARWLIGAFGPDVNLENIHSRDVVQLEAMRHGLNRAVEYRFFDAYEGKPTPPVEG